MNEEEGEEVEEAEEAQEDVNQARMQQRLHASHILPGLLVGSELVASSLEEMQREGITAVLVMSWETPTFFPGHFRYLRLHINDRVDAPLIDVLDCAVVFIECARSCGGSVLVHCVQGISRSPAVAMAYIIGSLGLSMEAAYDFVQQRRPCVAVNEGFQKQLRDYDELWRRRRHSGWDWPRWVAVQQTAAADNISGSSSKPSSPPISLSSGPHTPESVTASA